MMPSYLCHADHLPRRASRHIWAANPSDAAVAYLGHRLRSLSLQPQRVVGQWIYLALVKRGTTAKEGYRPVRVLITETWR